MATLPLCLAFLVLLTTRIVSEKVPSAVTESGTIIGETVNTVFQNKEFTVDRYLGIPYAKPPVGDLRFKKPESYGLFKEPFSATKFGPACPQIKVPFLSLGDFEQSEDCLFMNLYVPKQKPDTESGHAVMFFIHGGGFSLGSGNVYQGEVLASVGNVIVIAINYRLGLFGFLDLDDGQSEGNFGLWDQRLALQWVNKNIGAFGGDKDRVTIFGQSAGSMSVAQQLFYPDNEGLFLGGITESGAHLLPGLYLPNNIEAAKYIAENMSCSIENIGEVFQCLKTASVDDVIEVVSDAFIEGPAMSMRISTAPTIDGDFVKMKPADLYKKSQTENVPEVDFYRSKKLINGINGEEGAMFLYMIGDITDMDDLEVTREQMNTQHMPTGAAMVYGARHIPDVVTQLLISEYTNWEDPDSPQKLREELVRLFGDVYFNVPGVEMSRIHNNASNAESYLFNFVAFLDYHFIPTPNWVKLANYGDEVGPIFGYNFDFEFIANLTDYTPHDWELNLSKRMMKYLTNFAKTGNPNEPASEDISSVTWPKYDIASQSYIIFDKEDSTGQYLYARERDFWRNIIPSILDATEHAQTITSQYGDGEKDTCDKDGNC